MTPDQEKIQALEKQVEELKNGEATWKSCTAKLKMENESITALLSEMAEALEKIKDWSPKQSLPNVWVIAEEALTKFNQWREGK